MNINYIGLRATANFKTPTRLAEILYNDEDERDTKIAKYVIKLLRINGYKVDNGVSGWAAIPVDNRDNYDEILQDYKKFKRHAQLWIKFGL